MSGAMGISETGSMGDLHFLIKEVVGQTLLHDALVRLSAAVRETSYCRIGGCLAPPAETSLAQVM